MTALDRLTYCDLCDVLGPPESATRADSLALHRALHQTSRAFSLALRPVTDVARNLMQSLRDLLGGDEAHIATHARPGDTRTRALRRTETTRRSAMHTAYRHKTRHRLPVHTEDTMTTDDLRGVPAVEFIAAEYGITPDQVRRTTDDLRTCSHSFAHCTCDPYCDVIKCTTCGIDRRDDDD